MHTFNVFVSDMLCGCLLHVTCVLLKVKICATHKTELHSRLWVRVERQGFGGRDLGLRVPHRRILEV